MRAILTMCLFFLFVCSLHAEGEKDEDPVIEALIEAIQSQDKDMRTAARHELMAIGERALPYLEKKMRESSSRRYFDLYVSVKQMTSESSPIRVIDTSGLEALPKPDPNNIVEQYMYIKYQEVLAHYQNQRYDEATMIVDSALRLEPRSAYAIYFRKLKVDCDAAMVKTSYVMSRIVPSRELYEVGDTIDFTLQMTNTSHDQISLLFTQKRSMILQFQVQGYDPLGSTLDARMSEVFEFDRQILLPVGRSWEREMSAGKERHFNDRIFRTIIISAKPVLVQMTVHGEEQQRWMTFEPVTIKVLPRGYVKRLNASPLTFLRTAIVNGGFNDVFIAAVLLSEKDLSEGIPLLISTLKRAEGPAAHTIMKALRFHTGHDYELNISAWLKWWEHSKWNVRDPKDVK